MKIILLFCLLSAICLCQRTLLVIDNINLLNTHQQFIEDLSSSSKYFEMKSINNANLKIKDYDEYIYDTIVLMCLSESNPSYLNINLLLDYFDQGGNLLIIGDLDTSPYFRTLFNEMGITLMEQGSNVQDHFNNYNQVSNIINPIDLLTSNQGLLYRGSGMALTLYENQNQYTLLTANHYSFVNGDNSQIGRAIILAAAIQAKNNARAILTASLDFFSNEFYTKSNNTNRNYVNDQMLKYVMQKKNVIKVVQSRHFFQNDPKMIQHGEYKIKDKITYQIQIQEYDDNIQGYKGYYAEDLQVEFVMLDPYIRQALKPVMNLNEQGVSTFEGWYQADFACPDQHGVFHFKVIYRRPLFSFINQADKIPVRPFKHNEYERFLLCAYPYYISVFSTLLGFVIFLYYFLYLEKNQNQISEQKKIQ